MSPTPTEPMEFHSPAAIAALLTILVRNAEDLTQDFGSFEGQIAKTKALVGTARAQKLAGAEKFARIAGHVEIFFNTSEANKALFKAAHEAIQALLVKLPTSGWGPCNYVSHALLKQLIAMENEE